MNLTDIYLRLRALILRKRVEQDLRTELDFHVEMMARQNMQKGMTADEARRQAVLTFGAGAGIAEDCRDARGVNLVDSFVSDLRYAFRQFRRAPGFVAVAILSLALGIGANTAIFTLIDELMLRSLPVKNPESLVSLRPWASFPPSGSWTIYLPSFSRFTDLQKSVDAFSDMAAVYQESAFIDGMEVRFAVVSANYFTTLGVNAAAGRTFTPDEDRGRGNHPVALISHTYWQRHYGLAPDVLGRTFSLKGTIYTIVGIMPAGFSGDEIGVRRDVWFPMTMIAQVMSDRAALAGNPDLAQVSAIARLKPGITLKQAESQVQTVYRQLVGGTGAPLVRLESHAAGYSRRREYYAKPVEVLAIVIGVVLLIACANVANLLLARAAARQKETAVRLALGADRLRILRQHLTESMLLALLAGAAGLGLATAGTQILGNMLSVGPLALELDFTADKRVLAFAAAVSLFTGILFGTAPAWRASRVPLLRVSSLTSAGATESQARFGPRQLLVISQVSLSIFLLVVAGLFVRTFRNLKFQDLGYDRQNVLLVTSDRMINLDGKAVAETSATLRARIESIPGVVSVGIATGGLLSGTGNGLNPVTVEGYTRKPTEATGAGWNIVGPGYFATIGMRLTGRDFTDSDIAGGPRVAIINETMARHYFGNTNPIGKRFGVRRDKGNEIEIIGVLGDAKYNVVREETQDMIYFPYQQEVERLRAVNLVVRTKAAVPGLPARVKEILTGIAPDFPIVSIEWMDGQLDRMLMIERVTANLAGLFGALAALLACVGLYGVISYTVARRTSEIGMRLALGAQRADVLGMVIKESLTLVLIGIVIGVPASLAAAHLVSSQLFGVKPADPLSAGIAVIVIIACSAVAAFIPARRAATTDPMIALRYE